MDMLKKVLKIALITFLVSMVLSIIFTPMITRNFQNKYYKEAYRPESIEAGSIGDFPKSCRIKDVPWISYKKGYCQSGALQMIAQKYGVREDIGYFNFLMGFTYGAFYRADMGMVFFYEDPIPGLRVAGPYAGLKMKILTTDEKSTFLKALRFYISRGQPVIVQLDAGRLWGETAAIPHSELFMGYDESGFEYFETGKEDRFRTGVKGSGIDNDGLSDAVARISKELMYPWKFLLIVFEKDLKKKDDLREIWLRNGNSLIGKKSGFFSSGSYGIEQFALKLKKTAKIKGTQTLESAAYTRLDNAKFLQRYFRNDGAIADAAGFLKEAGEKYESALELSGKNDNRKIGEAAELLAGAASLERKAGEIFLKKGGK
jgi:hypothetical protein